MKSHQPDLPHLLAKTLKALRGTESQVQFAKKLGISAPSLNRFEAASQNCTLETLQKLCHRLDCPVGDLFLDEAGLELAHFRGKVNRLVEVREEAKREVAKLKKRRPKDVELHAALDAALGDFIGKIEGMASSGGSKKKSRKGA